MERRWGSSFASRGRTTAKSWGTEIQTGNAATVSGSLFLAKGGAMFCREVGAACWLGLEEMGGTVMARFWPREVSGPGSLFVKVRVAAAVPRDSCSFCF